ncbi:DUF3289 family protein [Erwinia sp. CGal63]|uniref:DUF3289 family protein n=1 Tax=Erwinia sp. CGal63 TaxID=2919889 RepID=UPI00300827AF
MSTLQLPCTLFRSQNRMDDYGASDMRCGDLTEPQLKTQFHLVDVSARANPWTLAKVTAFNQPQSMFYGSRGEGEKIPRERCAAILFDELRHLSRGFAWYGPYRPLISEMITHFQYGDGQPFYHPLLNSALKRQIVEDKTDDSSLLAIKDTLTENMLWEKSSYPAQNKMDITKAILDGRVPKFCRLQDNVNGMGITVHDIWATQITLKSLHIEHDCYRALIHYKCQDHFGLDEADILKTKFNLFRFFRIWFVLQRYNKFGFRPFLTNMEATIEISGNKNGGKK